jgi:predicted esterase
MRAGFLDARPSGRKKPDPSSAPVSAPPDATSWRSRAPGATRAFLDAACAERWSHGHEVVSPPEASSSPSENLLVLLHGRGERSAAPFAAFARKLNLPHTTCLSLAGPSPLPFGVPGREWFARLDPETGEDLRNDANPNDSRLRADSLRRTQKALDYLLDKLTDVTQGGWPSTNVHLFGFSDGGTVAIEIGAARVGQRRLGGCVSVSAALLPENVKRSAILYPPEARAPTPFALTCGAFDTVITRTAVEETARVLLNRNPGAVAETFVCLDKNTHAMVNGDHETRFLMRFWGGTLSSPRMRAEDIGTDVVEITNETVELSKLTKAVSSEPR